MPSASIEVLRQITFLEDAEPEALQKLSAAARERSFAPGQTIVREGTTGREVYIIAEGLVEVVKGEGKGETVLSSHGPGQVFGEMSYLEGQPRFATVRALEPTTLLELSESAMQALMAEQPQLLLRTTQILSSRLRKSDLQMIADLKRKNEELARAYRQLQQAQAALVEKERLERELELAREIQHSFLPHTFPQLPGFACAARYRAARQVGGDFYDVIPLGEQRVGLVMADVSDKGLAAALFMALTRSLIRAEALRDASPRTVLLNVNRLLLEMSQSGMFVTVFYGVLDVGQGLLQYARAGHDRPLLLRAATGEVQVLDAEGMALGVLEGILLQESAVGVGPGDLLVLYTDGITDASSSSGEFFGMLNLQDAVSAGRAESTQDLCNLIFEGVDRFQADAEQFDDMALLLARLGSAAAGARHCSERI
jgi:serine phosphatase RsbU (regulator of sigma subunit)